MAAWNQSVSLHFLPKTKKVDGKGGDDSDSRELEMEREVSCEDVLW